MTVDQMRREIILPYNNDTWKAKVSCMSDDQVLAIYTRFVRDKKLPCIGKYTIQECAKPAKIIYCCDFCGAKYRRDNPDIEECEKCGQKWD